MAAYMIARGLVAGRVDFFLWLRSTTAYLAVVFA